MKVKSLLFGIIFRMMSSSLETEIESIYEDLLFCEMFNIIFEVHRAVKKGKILRFIINLITYT